MIGRINAGQNNLQNDLQYEGDFNNSNFHSSYDEFSKLKDSLLSQYPFSLELINSIQEKFSFEMNFNNITAQKVLNEIEAQLLNYSGDVDEKILKKVINDSLDTCIKNNKGKKKNAQNNKNIKSGNLGKNLNNLEISSNNNSSNKLSNNFQSHSGNRSNLEDLSNQKINFDLEGKEIKFEVISSYNEKNLSSPYAYNSKEITCTLFSNFEINEYSMIPKDDDVVFEEYADYFKFYKDQFFEAYQIEKDDPLLDVDKFFLLVTFANYEGKPIISDIELVNPLKNYTKYSLKIENENIKDYYFFTGQMVYVEGYVKNKEIYAQKIIFGINPVCYTVSDSYIKGFFQDSNPFLIFAVNGPIFNKSNLDFTLFLKTLTHIAEENPHALILNGPILNVDNTMIMSGDLRVNEDILGDSIYPGIDGSNMNYFELFEFIILKINEIFKVRKNLKFNLKNF